MRHCKNCNALNNDVDKVCVACNKSVEGVVTINIKEEKGNEHSQNDSNSLVHLNKCLEDDSTSNSLLRISEVWLAIGVIVAVIQLMIILFAANFMQKQASESFFAVTILPTVIGFFITIGIAWMFSLILKAIAHIVQNTKNSARILEYQTKLLIEKQAKESLNEF